MGRGQEQLRPRGFCRRQEGDGCGEGWNPSGEPARPSRAVIHPTSRADPLAAPLTCPEAPLPIVGAHSTRPCCLTHPCPPGQMTHGARRWPGMKSSRLSPAGRLWVGPACSGQGWRAAPQRVLCGGRKADGRGSLAGSRLPLSSGFNLGTVGGRGSGQLGGSSETQEQAKRGTRLQAVLVQAPRGTMGCLFSLGQELWVGVGRGGRARRRREAGWSTPPAAPWGSHCTAWPSSPGGKAEGTGAAGRGGPGYQDFVSVPSATPRPREHLLASGTKG